MGIFNPMELWRNKKEQVVLFSSTAIALYGYDQGMMSLINTNYSYLDTMGIAEDSSLVGLIVSVYYLGCAVGAILASSTADRLGRKVSIFGCLATASLGNLLMFISGLGVMHKGTPAIACMFVGRVVMGLGIGGIDAVIPVYSSELSEDEERGKGLAQEFQANILGLNVAFAVNLAFTNTLGKENQWAWRLPIILMQLFPLTLMALMNRLPESPRYHMMHDRQDDAKAALELVYGKGDELDAKLEQLRKANDEESDAAVRYWEMLFRPRSEQFHPTVLTVMAQVNQALTGYGAVSVYGPQIFELLGFAVHTAEYITMANYISYFLLMTLAWLLIDAVGRRSLMLWGSVGLTACFAALTVLGALAQSSSRLGFPSAAVGVPGAVVLFVATGAFGVGWLPQVFLLPTEMYPTAARAKGTSISVVTWGLANFLVTLGTPILFNNLSAYLFLVFAATNLFAGWFTRAYQPETGGRSFEENQDFFRLARDEGTWRVGKVDRGRFLYFPGADGRAGGEEEPLLERVQGQL